MDSITSADVISFLDRLAEVMPTHEQALRDLDAQIGDGDLGVTVRLGTRAMAEASADRTLDQYADQTPQRIILDCDATDDETHGQQQLTGFHGYYDEHCYLPLIVTARIDGGPDELLAVLLRPGKIHAAENALPVLKRIVAKLRQRWPNVDIIFRADSGFAKPEIYDWCEDNKLSYLIGLARNSRLLTIAKPWMEDARAEYEQTGEKVRRVYETRYAADIWRHQRRVIVKAEVMADGDNPRFVVTNLSGGDPEALYDEYAMRGDAENRIKELKCDLQIDRTSCHHWWANQLRLLLASLAYTLMETIRRVGLKGTELARAQCTTIRLKLFKVGAIITRNTRRIRFLLSSACPYQELFATVVKRLDTS